MIRMSMLARILTRRKMMTSLPGIIPIWSAVSFLLFFFFLFSYSRVRPMIVSVRG